MKSFFRQLWSSWALLAARLTDFQARWILTIFYFTLALPFGLLTRLALDPLRTHRAPAASGWVASSTQPDGDLAAQREF